MSYKFMPFVLDTVPRNMSVDVSPSTDISIVFSTDMDPGSLPGNIIVQTASGGVKVSGELTYRDRTAVFTPAAHLDPATAYMVIVAGDTDLEDSRHDGVKSILGYPMAGVHMFTFTTAAIVELSAPQPLFPANLSVVEAKEVSLTWRAVEGAAAYEVQLATTPEVDPVLWHTVTDRTSVVPGSALACGNYFWRVRCLDATGNPGEWSAVASFAIDAESGEEDAPATGPQDYPPAGEPVLEVPEGSVDVDPEVEALVVRLPYPVDSAGIRVRLVGRSLAGDPTEDHGLIPVDVAVEPDGIGVRVIIRAQGEGQ